MDFVIPILNPIVESLLVPVKRHLGYLVSSSNKVRCMHEKVTELEDSAQDIRTRRDLNIGNRQVVPHRVEGWLAEVEEVIKSSKETIPIDGVGCFNIKSKYIAGKKSSKILKVINRLMEEKTAMEWTEQIMPLGMVTPPRQSTSEAVHEEDQNQNENRIESRDIIFKKALKSLEPNNETQMMALCGMGGVGKTTMMEDLKKAAEDKKMFDYIIKVVAGQDPNPIYVQQTVAEYLGPGALTETTKETRAQCLKKKFEKILNEGKKKILLILDDVWKEFNLKDIGLASPLPNGFKLLFTSRDENVCIQMGVETSFIFKIVVLKDEEAKTLFWGLIGLVSDTDPEPDLHQIGEDILKRCGGLPIAIKTIASYLKVNKKIYAWKDAFNCLQQKTFYPFDPRAIFEISYMNLKEDDLKAIFILSGLFPEDYNIKKEDLLVYGWGLNFFKGRHTIATARNRVHTCVDTLIGLNLLIKSDHEHCVKMHDLVRDFILSNFSEVKQASIVNHNNNASEQLRKEVSYERILLKCGYKFEFSEDFNLNQPNLALLALMDGQRLKFPRELYTSLEKLEVVAYKNMRPMLLPQYTTNLRVLALHYCTLLDEDISFLGDLINLEVLGLAHCNIRNLPSKIGKLKKLRILDVTGCSPYLCIDDGVIQNLDKLEELYMEVAGGTAVEFTNANWKELKMLLIKLSAVEIEFLETAQLIGVSFEKLERFKISVGCLLNKDRYYGSDWNSRDEYSLFKNTLKLVTSVSELIAWKFNELFRKTEILHLEVKDMSCLEDILMLPPQISFSSLKALNISNCGGLTYLFTIPVAKSLTKLESLEIWSCDALRSLVYGENTEEARVITFPKLESMRLSNLRELVSLCGPAEVILELPKLVRLHLDELLDVTSIFPMMESHHDAKITNFHLSAPVDICGDNGERKNELVKGRQKQEINTMSKEGISKVGENMSLFAFQSNHITPNFHHLREIWIHRFEGVEVVFAIEPLSNKDQLLINEQKPIPLLPYLKI